MISPIHNELNIRGDHTKLTNDQLVADEWKMVLHILFEILYVFKVIVVRVVAYNNVRVCDDVFKKTKTFVFLERVRGVFVWDVHLIV
jgi:hypothetical protein